MKHSIIRRKKQLRVLLERSNIDYNPINNSKSKMNYSFSKANRFKSAVFPEWAQRTEGPDSIYDLPDLMKKRSTSLGYGERLDFTVRRDNEVSPSPQKYNLGRGFVNNRKGKSFASSRADIRFGDPFLEVVDGIPGPGKYDLPIERLKNPITFKSKARGSFLC